MQNSRIHSIFTISLILVSLLSATLTTFSFLDGKLYSPFGALAKAGQGAVFYMGISVYITIGASAFTSAIIRIALRLSK